jgi:hypothetical protein
MRRGGEGGRSTVQVAKNAEKIHEDAIQVEDDTDISY